MKYLLLTLLSVFSCATEHTSPVPTATNTEAPSQASSVSDEFISQLFEVCGVKISAAKRTILVQDLRAVSDKYFIEERDKQSFLYLICIESKFNSAARSKVGAVGYAQIMPKYAQTFANMCNLGELDKDDVADPTINLHLGACLFSTLLKKFNGNVALALAGYNSGAESDTTKRLSKIADGHPETMGYVAKYFVLEQRITNERSSSNGTEQKMK